MVTKEDVACVHSMEVYVGEGRYNKPILKLGTRLD
jgi:hypothetical protein